MTPQITVFAPLGKLKTGESPSKQIVVDFLGYTPYLVPGATYGSITITKVNGVFFANGKRIVKSDVPTKNGVVHYLEDEHHSEDVHTPPSPPLPRPPRCREADANVTRVAPQDDAS
jgi:hypothetical protein